jgi:PAS domain S-box-containing protein
MASFVAADLAPIFSADSPWERREEALFRLSALTAEEDLEPSALLEQAAAIVAAALDAEFGACCRGAEDSVKALRVIAADAAIQERPVEILATLPIAAESSESFVRFALNQKRTCAAADLFAEQEFHERTLVAQGIRAGLICPLIDREAVLGGLAVLTTRPRTFTPAEQQFVETVAQWITLSMARQQAEEELAAAKDYVSSLSRTVNALELELDAQGRIQAANEACVACTGLSLAEMRDRTLWNALLIPEEVNRVKQTFERLFREGTATEFESYILTKDGERRRVSWTCAVTRDSLGQPRSISATGLDITPRGSGDDSDASAPLRVREAPAPKRIDRRQRPRSAFPYKQKIAPFASGSLPLAHHFCEVQCRDIAANGFSYVSPVPPQYRSIVVAFGLAPSELYLAAEIQHVTALDMDGVAMFVIGCRYRERVSYPQRLGRGALNRQNR